MSIMETTSPRPGSMSLTIDQPFSIEAEQRAIGLVLHWPKTWNAFAKMRPDDFFDDNNALIWAAIVELRAKKLPADLPAVLSQLAPHFSGMQDQRAQHIRDYMTNCVLSVISVTSYQETAALLYGMARKRRLARTVATAARRISTGPVTDTAENIASETVRQIQLDQGSSDSMIDAGDIVRNILDTRFDPIRISSTGWPRFDAALAGGFVENFYYVIGGRKKGLKTTTLISLVYNMIVRDDPIPIDYYCLEATAQQVFQKLLARWVSEVWCKHNEPRGYCMTDGDFRNRWIKDQKWFGEAMEAALEYFTERGLCFVSPGRMDIHELSSRITSAGIEGRTRGSIVDYAQLIRSKLADKGEMTAHLDNIHQTLSELAVANPQWILAAVQLNQTGGVRGGEGANQSASMVLHLHKIWANKNEPGAKKKYKAFFEMVDTRYTAEGNIGDSGEEVEDEETGEVVRMPEPAYWLDGDIGPCLREYPSPQAVEDDLKSIRR